MYVALRSPLPLTLGMGATSPGALVAGGAAVAAGSVAALASAGIIAGAAVPFIGPAIAAVTLAIEAILNSGCGQTCVVTSQWANQAEALLVQNIQQYFAQPAPRAQSLQTLALQNFDKIWSTLVQQCSQAGTGAAGQRCISDRQAGACTWKQTTTSPLLAYAGEPQPGDCWNWFSGYRDPIADDPNVVPDSALSTVSQASSDIGSAISSAFGGTSNTGILLLLAAAGLLVAGVMTR